MSKQIKLRCCLFFMDLNHSIAEAVLFHWFELCCSHDFAVDSVEDSFADLAYLRFGGLDQSAGWFVGEVRFVAFEGYECFFVSCLAYPVVYTQFRSQFRTLSSILSFVFCRLPTLLQTCRALYDHPSWKNSASPTRQRIFRFHHKMTIYSDSSKKPSISSAECVGKLTSSSTLAQSATLKIHTALNQPRTHLRSKN